MNVAPMLLLASLLSSPSHVARFGDVTVSTLPNGLTIAVKEYHAVPGVSLRIYVRVGSALEEEFLGYGLSHYCEHVVSGGTTAKRTEEETDRLVQLIGAQRNAYTTYDHTCYHMYCAAEHWKTAFELLADGVMHCAMSPTELEREKGVITREINMGEDEPRRVVHKLLMQTVFPRSPLGVPTIGFRDNFVTLTPEQVASFYKRFYVPNNTVVVIVGNVETEDVLATVEEVMGSWPRGSLFRVPLPEEPPQTAPRWVSRPLSGQVAYLRIAWPTVRLTHPDLYALDLLAAVLGHGTSSRLSRSVKEDQALAFDIGAYSHTPAIAPGPFVVYALVPSDKVNEAVEAILTEVEAAKDRLVPRDELERAKKGVIANYRFGQQSCEDMAATIGTDLLGTGDPTFSASYTSRIATVTAEDVRRVARQYLSAERLNVVCLGGEPLVDRSASAGRAPSEVSQAKITLPNGLRVVSRTNPSFGVVSIVAFFRAGNRHETDETNGLFTLLARMLIRGTARRTAAQVFEAVESRGGSIESGSGKDAFWVRLNLLAEDVEFGMRLLGELLTEPAFNPAELEKQKAEALASIQEQENNWQIEAINFLLQTYFDGHPYHLNGAGSRELIPHISVEMLRSAFESYVRAGSCVVAVCGGADASVIERAARTYLGRLPSGSCPEPPPASLPARTELARASKANDKAQVAICVGFPGPPSGHPDEYPVRLLDAITSGINLPRGWLHEALRGRNDLVYFVHLTPILYHEAGLISVLTQCQPELVDTVLSLIQTEIARARAGAFTEEDVEAAKGEYLTAIDNQTQTAEDQAFRLASFELFRGGYEAAFDFADRVRAVTVEDVRRVARDYLQGGVLTLVGPVKERSAQ